MGYLKAVLNNKQDSEIKNLKILIRTGKKLKKNVSKYERELKKYNGSISTTKKKKIEPIKVTTKKIKKPKISKIDTNKLKYTISSVYTKKNAVIINFKTNITKNFVKYSEKKVK